MKRLLLIEDDPDVARLIHDHLHQLPGELTTTELGNEGLELLAMQPFDICILDLLLPDASGFEICRRIRQRHPAVPLLILSGRAEERDKVTGLEAGADDYLTKPFSVPELLARLRALLRRSELTGVSKPIQSTILVYQHGALRIEVQARIVTVSGQRIELTPKEFDLLTLLASYPGKSFSRQKILSLVWGYHHDGYEHTVTAHINRLRIKIEPDFTRPIYILTTWGIGYRFADSDNPTTDALSIP
ncbi:response regulator transcription factor [Spirosoma linguale]|uniref:Phosphate regulon transcriptional regulatory protein PhoB n=1 Tax=Spirosoma linguale (strain ATCC 33905 / DSM 74 / LMG 10896 / Claus 1) TaxID=504472 RepID=D2QGK1_SPILD|nr:two component transcriptional regulator, winged helix family [Spirosoma linguale DSM 74]